MNQFFDLIYGDLEGHVSIVTRDEDGNLTDAKWFEYPAELPRMTQYISRRNDEDIYNSVTVFSTPSRSKLDVNAMSRVVYADADTCSPDKFRMPPTIVVTTSPGRYHCYWVLDENVPADKAAQASQRIYLAHKDQGCDAGWAVSKLLRVPETTNLKRSEAFPVTAEYYPENIYTLDTFESVYNDVTPTTFEIVSSDLPEPVTPEEYIALEDKVEQAGLGSLYYDRPSDSARWYELLFRLELDLFREGLDAREVFWIAHNAACNKYARDNRAPSDLWKDVQKAYNVFLEDEYVEPPATVDKKEPTRQDFLTLEERKRLTDNPCFVDEYLAWATSKTDAAEVYHRSLSYMLLSQVFGGRAKLVFKHNPMGLNIWVTIAGDTTLTRKSTAKDLMVSLLHAYETKAAVPSIDVGRDANSEGLIALLGEASRDGRPSLLVIEEFQEWLHSTMTKNYMAGTLGKFTDLYNGEVPVVLRATQGAGNKRRNETSFSLIGVGIRTQIARTLTKEHFASGFLARMCWAVADTPPYSDKFGIIERRADPNEKATFDAVRENIANKLWKATKNLDYDKDRVIDFSDEAWDRFLEWTVPLTKEAYYSPMSEVTFPTADRMKYSVAKAAALLALYDKSPKIELIHVLHALAQGELWYRDMLRMAGEISSSDYEAKLDEVERFIASGSNNQRKDASVRRQFARYRASEYDDIINSLKKQGRVRTDPTDRQILQAL